MEEANKEIYILVHGAWHGGWCWDKIRGHLQKLGHEVSTPDLPGHSINFDPKNFPTICLQTYVDFVRERVLKSTRPAVLVGHSMGGIVISQVAEHVPSRINRLVYVSAIIPKNQSSLMDEEKEAPLSQMEIELTFNEEQQSIILPFHHSKLIQEFFYHTCDSQKVAFALSKLRPQPSQPFFDKISFSNDRFGSVPKLYVQCLQDKAINLEAQQRMSSRIGCKIATLNTDHSPFLCADKQLTELILRPV